MKVLKYGMSIIILLFVSLCIYEFCLLKQAQDKTPEIRERFLNAHEVTWSDMPKHRLEMLLKVEDPNFYNHDGVDFQTPGAGLTTITQGLAKFMYFDDFRPGFKKIEQTLIAKFVLDKQFTKDEQLSIFLNHAYLGGFEGKGIRGFQKASEVYFGTDLINLSDEQYLSLVAMLVAPNALHIKKSPEKNAQRVKRIEMVLDGLYVPKDLTDIFYDR